MYDRQVRRRRAVLFALVACCLVLLTAYFGESSGGLLKSVQTGREEVSRSRSSRAPTRAPQPLRDLFGWFGDTLDAKEGARRAQAGARRAAAPRWRELQSAANQNDELRDLLALRPQREPRRLRAGDRPGSTRAPYTSWYSPGRDQQGLE